MNGIRSKPLTRRSVLALLAVSPLALAAACQQPASAPAATAKPDESKPAAAATTAPAAPAAQAQATQAQPAQTGATAAAKPETVSNRGRYKLLGGPNGIENGFPARQITCDRCRQHTARTMHVVRCMTRCGQRNKILAVKKHISGLWTAKVPTFN